MHILRPFPFEPREMEGTYYVTANIEGEGLHPKYHEFFARHGYEGNGYCWEGHAAQILEALEPGLLEHIAFDSEGGTFFADADSEAAQMRFVQVLNPIFSDLEVLEEWVKKADRSRIND